jgi:eukaryotic-like serine/threonine-protein kinase
MGAQYVEHELPHAMSTPVGTLLNGRYRLDAQIGVGGMSRVFRAFDTLLERPVAIKLMHREVASHSEQLERFRREARAVAQLNHRHIVTVIDAGEDEGTPYIVFEYVEGETLKERIRREGRLPIAEAAAYSIEIARALGAAHSHSIVHRDVKPQNVLIDQEGTAKITDFGIARTLTEEGLTADGRVLGTTDYVSPEQALGQPVTGQSDLYSLGIVLYEMLTGEVPYRAENQVAVAMRHVREEVPDVQLRRPEVSAALAAVVDRATEKKLERRYDHASAFVADLEEALAIETSRAGHATGEVTTVLRTLPGTTKRRLPLRLRHRWRMVGVVAAAAAIVAAVLLAIASNTHRGTNNGSGLPPPTGRETSVSLGQNAAHDYNPFGNTPEHPQQVGLAVDGIPGTVWTTESYDGGNLNKPGVGLYVDASPGVNGSSVEITTQEPGFTAEIWGANTIVAYPQGDRTKTLNDRGWTQLTNPTVVRSTQRIGLDSGTQRFRYYLVWITQLPPGLNKTDIDELALYYRTR